VSWRPATAEDAEALRDLERAANEAGLAHVFVGRPFPDDEVLARWRATLAEPGVSVRLHEDAFTSWDTDGRVRHLGVHPRAWRTGLGREAVALAVDGIRASGASPYLWVLELNTRARGLSEHLGWQAAGDTRSAEWPPYPTELRMRLPESGHGG
jgi:GNAT superfamily N-acetyltransferase